MAGLGLLMHPELYRYCELIPDNEDLQDEWEAAVDDPGKYVTLLIGQKYNKEQREESDGENYHDPFEAEQTTQIFFLAYHEVKAHLKWVLSRPADSAAYKRFQVS